MLVNNSIVIQRMGGAIEMNRQQIEQEYQVENGVIRSLGKFEGEFVYAPYFYEFADEGEILSYMEDGSGEFVSLITIQDEDRKEFPEIAKDSHFIVLRETEQGFVAVKEVTREYGMELGEKVLP